MFGVFIGFFAFNCHATVGGHSFPHFDAEEMKAQRGLVTSSVKWLESEGARIQTWVCLTLQSMSSDTLWCLPSLDDLANEWGNVVLFVLKDYVCVFMCISNCLSMHENLCNNTKDWKEWLAMILRESWGTKVGERVHVFVSFIFELGERIMYYIKV